MPLNSTVATPDQVQAVLKTAATLDSSLSFWNITLMILAVLVAASAIVSTIIFVVNVTKRNKEIREEIKKNTPTILRQMLQDNEEGEQILNIIMDDPRFQGRIHDLIEGQIELRCERATPTENINLIDLVSGTFNDGGEDK